MNITVSDKQNYSTLITVIDKSASEAIIDFEGETGEIAVRYDGNDTIIYCSTGENEMAPLELKEMIASAVKMAIGLKRDSLSIALPDASSAPLITEAALLASFIFEKYKSEKKGTTLENLELVGTVNDTEKIEVARVIAESTLYARELINTNATDLYPAMLAEEAKEIAKSNKKIKVHILDEKEIQKEGLGLLYAVGKGSHTPPRLIFMEYLGNPDSDKKVAITGKGVTFDAGGQNLKPTGSIETMRLDMSGAACTLGVMKAIAALNPKINVVGVVTSAHNAISSEAYLPGDIYKGYDGTTVEVLNTDAEGRLCLADAISYCKKNYNPTEIIDIATLTGAIVIALGNTISGLFSNNDLLADNLFKAGEKSGDQLWRLPIRKEHRESMKSDLADLRNISKNKRSASSITAAAFLEHFAGDTPWAHLDIAGTAWNDGEAKGTQSKYGTGAGVRLIMEYLLNQQ